jgi:hypothetical protein
MVTAEPSSGFTSTNTEYDGLLCRLHREKKDSGRVNEGAVREGGWSQITRQQKSTALFLLFYIFPPRAQVKGNTKVRFANQVSLLSCGNRGKLCTMYRHLISVNHHTVCLQSTHATASQSPHTLILLRWQRKKRMHYLQNLHNDFICFATTFLRLKRQCHEIDNFFKV